MNYQATIDETMIGTTSSSSRRDFLRTREDSDSESDIITICPLKYQKNLGNVFGVCYVYMWRWISQVRTEHYPISCCGCGTNQLKEKTLR